MGPDTPADSSAARVDRAVDTVLQARPPILVEPALRDVIAAAAAVRAAHPLLPPGAVFEERLAARLRAHASATAAWPRALAGIRGHRLLFAGAVGSAAVSVAGVTAIAVWRAAHPPRGARS